MRRLVAVAALLLAASSAKAAAIHSDPAAGDNLRIYTLLKVSPVALVLDGAPAVSIDGQSVMFTRLAPGAHTWSVTLPDGSRASADFTLSADGMIESKARRWWCAGVGVRNNQLTLLQLPSAQCKALADEGPD